MYIVYMCDSQLANEQKLCLQRPHPSCQNQMVRTLQTNMLVCKDMYNTGVKINHGWT